MTKFLQSVNHSDIPDEETERTNARKLVTEALHRCQKYKYPSVLSLFDDVYDKLPKHLADQRAELKEHLLKYADKYDFL